MRQDFFIVRNTYKFTMLFKIIILKILYLIVVDMMLPDRWELWGFDKNVNYSFLPLEMVFFIITGIVYLYSFNREKTSSFLCTILFVLYFIPNNSSLVLSGYSLDYYIINSLFSVFLFYFLGTIKKVERSNFDYKTIWENKRLVSVFTIVTVMVCIICIAYVYSVNGLRFDNLFGDMYSARAEYAEYYMSHTNSFLSYFIILLTGLYSWVLPISLYFCIMNKKIFHTLLCLFAFLCKYSMSHEKYTLFIVGVIILICVVDRGNRIDKINDYFLSGMVFLMLFSIIEYKCYGISVVFSVIIRRLMYLPEYLVHVYYEFFKVNPKMWFTQDVFLVSNVLSKLFGRPYAVNAIAVISESCFGGGIPSPNTGLFAEAYSQLGVIGVFIFPIIIKSVVGLMDKFSAWLGYGFSLVIMVVLSLKLLSIQVLVSSTLVGIILFLIISYMLKITYDKRKGEK